MKNWLPSLSLSLMAFIFVTTEFIPVGLLPEISESFDLPISKVGLLLTIYAWIVALLSLPLAIFTSRYERKKLVLIILALFTFSNLVAGLSTSFTILVVARIMIAFSHAIFWSVSTPLAIRLAPEGKKNIALAIIVTGASLGNVLGIPVGTLLGHAFGWKNAFLSISGISFLILFVIYFFLPKANSTLVAKFKDVPRLVKNKTIRTFYYLTAIVITGHFILFTYISPLFQNSPLYGAEDIALLLLVFGSAGILGGYIAGKFIERFESRLIYIGLVCVFLSLVLTSSLIEFKSLSILNLIMWGIGFTIAPFVFQAKIITEAKEASDIAVSMYSGIFNIGIGGGAFLGSIAVGVIPLNALGYLGAIFILISIFVWMKSGIYSSHE